MPILHDKHPDGMIIHCGTNDIKQNNLCSLRPNELATQIIEVGKLCQLFGVKNMAISSILLKSDESLNVKIQEIHILKKNVGFTILILFQMKIYQ